MATAEGSGRRSRIARSLGAALRHSPSLIASLVGLGLLVFTLISTPAQPVKAATEQLSLLPSSASATQPSHRQLRALFVGASITAGWGATAGDSYPDLVRQQLVNKGIQVDMVVKALPGARIRAAASWQLPVHQQLVVVQIATNDAHGRAPEPLPVYSDDYSALLQRLRSDSPEARLLCLGAWNSGTRRNIFGYTAAQYDDAIKSACEANAGTYVDLRSIFDNRAAHGPLGRMTAVGPGDLFHPNDLGHSLIAALLMAKIGPIDNAQQGGVQP